jgi:hypothetical protein
VPWLNAQRYFKEPAPGCDLSAGFDTFVKKDEEKEKQEHITPILSWLHHQRAGGSRASCVSHPASGCALRCVWWSSHSLR